ncbi:hypothetical protein DV515_00007080 [Chloebia gouldiae]|uniref:Ras-related protein Rab-39B n=1 Tax=Chloebia gouldiae TaxID=44316 RepID=A0A3L8SJ80_CHLGU|nr:hypothetical protein DV515_00007080 [Chloebia gouldiae]
MAFSCPVFCRVDRVSITRAYYRNSVGGLLLFDITNRRSFQNVHEWLEETKVHVQPYQIVFVLVGHKCDLDTQRQVTRHEAEKLAAAYGMKYIETSARDAINVEKAFTDLTRDIYELVKRGDISIQEGWEGVKSGFVPNVVHSSEEVFDKRGSISGWPSWDGSHVTKAVARAGSTIPRPHSHWTPFPAGPASLQNLASALLRKTRPAAPRQNCPLLPAAAATTALASPGLCGSGGRADLGKD